MSAHLGSVLGLVLLLAGCSSTSNTCTKACKHIAACIGGDAGAGSCPLSKECGKAEACEAECYNKASCEAIKPGGTDTVGAQALATCRVACQSLQWDGGPDSSGQSKHTFTFWLQDQKDIDILFVIDNSNSMGDEQLNLSNNFPKFIDALKSPKLNDKIPNVHIGIISTDLGAGSYALPSCEVTGGDGGKLMASPRVAGCVPPSKSYIEHIDGVTNVNLPSEPDPAERVKQAFQCIAEIGTGGCGFESQIEAARRALDPKLNRNPGFVRNNADLMVFFVTDEDDCSAAKPQLFDPNQNQINDPLGLLTSFRCFEFGVQCDCPGGQCTRTTVGTRSNCKPAFDWLYKIDDYITFFSALKPKGRLLLYALAGPTDKVEVGMDSGSPTLRPSCQTTMGKAVPGIRIKALIDGFKKAGHKAHFNEGISTNGATTPVTICSPDYSPALRLAAKSVVVATQTKCIDAPLVTQGGGLACSQGDQFGPGATCKQSCLDKADCTVTVDGGSIQRCAADKFQNPGDKDCGGLCPCWRIVKLPECGAPASGTPYALDLLHKGTLDKSSQAALSCSVSQLPWMSAGLAAMPQCL